MGSTLLLGMAIATLIGAHAVALVYPSRASAMGSVDTDRRQPRSPGDAALGDRYVAPPSWNESESSVEPWVDRPIVQRALNRTSPSLKQFRDQTGADWRAIFDLESQMPIVLFGSGAVVATSTASDEHLAAVAAGLVEQHTAVLGLPAANWVGLQVTERGRLRLYAFVQQFNGIPVRGSRLQLSFFRRNAHWVWVRLDGRGVVDIAVDPASINTETAERIVRDAIGRDADITPVGTEYVPGGRLADTQLRGAQRGRLVHSFEARTTNPAAHYIACVDAHDGEIRSLYDTTCYLDLIGDVSGFGSPALFPDVPAHLPVQLPLAGMTVTAAGIGSTLTDDNGSFTIPHTGTNPVDVTFSLSGPFVELFNSAGPVFVSANTLQPGSPASITFASTTQEEVAQINGFVHTNIAHAFVKSLDPLNTALDFPIPCVTNSGTSCNAFYLDGEIHFAVAASDCVNTCYSTIVYHEYGHALLDQMYGFDPGAYHEGMADAFTALLIDDPNIGLEFESGAVLRNVDTMDRTYPEHVTGESHDAGLIIGGAFWDTLVALDSELGHAAALELTRRLWLDHMMFQTGVITPLLTIDVLTIDDDDGNLLNGTPHYDAIAAGFGAHGLDAPNLEFFTFQLDPASDTVDEMGPYAITIDVASTTSTPLDSVSLLYSLATAPDVWITIPAVEATPSTDPTVGSFAASIPGQPSPACVRYYIVATDTLGRDTQYPISAPEAPLSFFVGTIDTIHFDDVGTDDAGVSHSAVTGQDDWQRGVPNVQGNNPWDPLEPFSAPNVWGNDLNNFGWNGDYPDNTQSFLSLPPIDCSDASGVKLRYHRWLTVESAPFDFARVWINGVVVWQNTSDVIDTEWTEVTHDISAHADGDPTVVIEFELQSNGFLEFGGWNLDDLHVFSVGPVGTTFVRGECNADGRLDIADPIHLLWSLFDGGSSLACEDACDADDDGALGIDDAIAMLHAFLLDGPPLPAPRGEVGVDPTTDTLTCD